MTCKGWVSTFVFLIGMGIWVGCKTPPPPAPYMCVDDVIRIGDTLTVNLLDVPDPPIDRQFVVAGDGNVNSPKLGPIPAAGKKFTEFESDVRKLLIEKQIYKDVIVSVKPGDRFYSVAGEVRSPARMIYSGKTTVLRAIATCGDFTEFANRRSVQITRADGKLEFIDCNRARKDPRYDLPICPGDYIWISRSF